MASSEAAIPPLRISIEIISNNGSDIIKQHDRKFYLINDLIPIEELSKPGLETILRRSHRENRLNREASLRAFFLFRFDNSISNQVNSISNQVGFSLLL